MASLVKVNCEYCGKERFKIAAQLKRYPRSFCSKECQSIGQLRRKLFTCVWCAVEFERPVSVIKKSKNGIFFCCQSHAAKYNNSLNPKRKRKPLLCIVCGVERKTGKRNIKCRKCHLKDAGLIIDRTLEEEFKLRGNRFRTATNIRQNARRAFDNSGRPKICVACGYKKHVEICHIMDVKDFPKNTKISVVNDVNNLVALCCNCHWEFDNGLLHLEGYDPSRTLLSAATTSL